MKKLLLLSAFTVGLMASCSDVDFNSSAETSQNNPVVAFSAGKNNQPSRSGVTITSLDKFTVSSVNPDNTLFFDGEQFNYADGVFKSSTPHYWPTTGTLSFYAISDVGEKTFTDANVPQYTYTGGTGEKDLVAATVIAGEKEIPYPLTFQHLTSQVIIGAEAENKTEELTYKLVSVEMTAPSTGIYSFADATGGTGTWSINNDQTTTYTFEEALPMSFAQNASNKLDNCYWNILPVTDGKIYFRVEYQVFQNGKIISDFTGENYKECTVENPNLQSGKIYTYNFILTRGTNSEITFTTTITDWNNGTSTDQTPELPKDPLTYIYSPSEHKAGVTFGSEKYKGAITIPTTTKKDGVVYNVTYIANNAFKDCHEVTSVTIPESVRYIQEGAFMNCTGLTSIDIPASVYSIGEKTFYGCSGLTYIEIPNGVDNLKKYTFSGCTSLVSVSVPNSVKIIGEGAFDGCSSLTTISIPSTVNELGENIFSGCTSLPVIDNAIYADTYLVSAASKDITECNIKEGTRFIGTNAFNHCTNLTSINIPETVSTIFMDAFQGCGSLTSLTIPSTVRSIGTRAFAYCSGITSLTLSEGLVGLGEQAFRGCKKIPSLNLPNSLTSLSAATFQDCTSLTSVKIGESISYMGNMIFYGCTNLRNVTISSQYPPSIGSSVFPSNVNVIYVPYETYEDYQSRWNEYSSKISPY